MLLLVVQDYSSSDNFLKVETKPNHKNSLKLVSICNITSFSPLGVAPHTFGTTALHIIS